MEYKLNISHTYPQCLIMEDTLCTFQPNLFLNQLQLLNKNQRKEKLNKYKTQYQTHGCTD